ncbi:16041_t:CDS:1 [Funneliformis caledonium]|uniref:16041_t:CDS:1 n=1 Tax=Funneliformis caledonium TaxID=1117310 RepID=A0A9N8VVR0_9GLOM|nr:16041_t:CDS:1 [Funneliformis caledonium]
MKGKQFVFVPPETPEETPEKRQESRLKREPNMFISFRKDMMRYKPYNMPMTKYSQLVSGWWKKLSKDKKSELQKQYQIKRDHNRHVKLNQVQTQGESLSKVENIEMQYQLISYQTQAPADIEYYYVYGYDPDFNYCYVEPVPVQDLVLLDI